jgi:hypothetical protein
VLLLIELRLLKNEQKLASACEAFQMITGGKKFLNKDDAVEFAARRQSTRKSSVPGRFFEERLVTPI